jgi:hypothetical protein
METTQETTALARIENHDQTDLMTIQDVKFRMDAVNQLMAEVMKRGPQGDYGVIPGTGDKPTLLKPGAEKLCTLFRLAPTYKINVTPMDRGHREYNIVCTLTHINTGKVWGQGAASASTMESKYRWRQSARKCPQCSKEAIIKGKAEYGGGWLCFKKKDGCGAKFAENDPAITSQTAGRVENEDVADTYNTVLKMATKRALVAAVLITTGASALFTQDLDEMHGDDHHEEPQQIPTPPRRQTAPQQVTPVQLASEDQQYELSDLMEATGTSQQEAKRWLAKAGVETFAEMPADKIQKCIEMLRGKQQQPAKVA